MIRTIKTTRFGDIEDLETIHFPNGILGFEEYKEWILVDPNDSTYILWLQSTSDMSLAIPIIPSCVLSLVDESLFFVCSIPTNIMDMTINEVAPIQIKEGLGSQNVLQNGKSVHKNIYKTLKSFIISKKV